MARLGLVARLAALAMAAVALAVAVAMSAAWRTTDRQLTSELDADLLTQIREWDRLAARYPSAYIEALRGTAHAWVTEQQDHPSTQLQGVLILARGGTPEAVVNPAWQRLVRGADRNRLWSTESAQPRDVRLADGSTYRALTRVIPTPTGGRGVVTVADSTGIVASARSELARQSLVVGVAAMVLAAALAGSGSVLLTRRLRRLGEVAAAAGAGDLQVRVGTLGGAPEVNRLGQALDSALERIERTMTAQRDFVADASHELRTPLAVIRAHAELLLLDSTGDHLAEEVRELLRHVDSARRLVDDLLTLATGDAAPQSLVQPRDIDLEDHAEDLRRELPLLGDQQFTISAVPGTVMADPARLDQVIRNLVVNAVAHTPCDGHIEVRLDALADQLRVCVRDDGCGMPPHVRDRVFERFARDSSSGSSTGRGVPGAAGLGLPLARLLVEAHGGSIALASEPGEGTTVTFLLPGYRPLTTARG